MPPKQNHGNGQGSGRQSDAGEFRNHGAEVSAAAHDAPKGRGQGHGQAVSDVARGGTGTSTPANPTTGVDVAPDDREPA